MTNSDGSKGVREQGADDVSASLAAMAEWGGDRPTPPLWEKAARSHGRARVLQRSAIVATAAMVVLAAGAILTPSLGTARRAPSLSANSAPNTAQDGLVEDVPSFGLVPGADLDATGENLDTAPFARQRVVEPVSTASVESTAGSQAHVGDVPAPMPRAIAYSDSLRLRVDDLALAFADTRALAEPMLGEFVGSTSFNASERRAVGEVLLRVRADRRGEVLMSLRELGELLDERSNASDVTSQLVDTDARIRNERRVEQELLGLIASRQDAPLEEIMEVRRSLADVRGSIERMEAQLAAMRGRVSLSEIRVTLVVEIEEEVEEDPSLWSDFADDLGDAWDAGVRGVMGSIAFLVRVLVGGAVFWVILLVVSVPIVRWIRAGAK